MDKLKNKMKHGNNSKDNTPIEVMHAKATTTVRRLERTVYDNPQEGPNLIKIRLEERFHGDIKCDGVGEGLMAINNTGESSNFTGIERLTGKIGEKEGTFLLQASGTTEGKLIRCDWFVIPGSGTGQLTGLRGKGGFRGKFGKGSEVHLDYWFE